MVHFHSHAQKPKLLNYQEVDKKLLHFGFSLGFNSMNMGIKRSFENYQKDTLFADVSKLQPGFNVHIISELRLTDNLALRCLPGLSFGERRLVFVKNGSENLKMSLESNFIDFPLLIKYKSKRINNYRPYLLLGGAMRYDLAARKDYDQEGNEWIRLKPLDYYAEIGFGIDWYLVFFKFSNEIKFSMGFRDILVHEPYDAYPQYTNAIEKLNSYLLTIAFNFE